MELFECTICKFSTHVKCNYQRHLKTKKHLKKCQKSPKNEEKMRKNEEKEEKKISENTNENQNNLSFFESKSEQICQFCSKKFSRSDSLQRHISVCKLNNLKKGTLKDPQGSKNVEKKRNFECHYCHNSYQTKRGLNKHVRTCLLREQRTLSAISTATRAAIVYFNILKNLTLSAIPRARRIISSKITKGQL